MDIIYLDLQKAFDKVPHSKLITKVQETGVEEDVVRWIENWLRDREQRVVVDGEFSEWGSVESGVPQGSILGPLLFSIFINDLDVGLNNSLIKFADDTKIWGKVNNSEDSKSLQADLNTLQKWSEQNEMPFNVSKCKVLHIGKKNHKFNYSINGTTLMNTDEEKDLGVTFNENFSPTINCKKVCKSAERVTGLIKRNIKNRSMEGMLILYKTLVRPILDYCSQVWKPFLKRDIKLVERVQKRFTKLIDGCKNLNYDQRLKKLKLTTIEDRHHRTDMIQVFKVLNDRSNVFPRDFLKLSERTGRKNSQKLFKKRINKELSKYAFSFRTIDKWNGLPDKVIMAENVNKFKGEFDRLMGSVERLS